MQVDFPGLAERVCLYEVTLIVYMEAMVYGMVLQFGNVTSHVDHSHPHNATGVRPKRAGQAPGPRLSSLRSTHRN